MQSTIEYDNDIRRFIDSYDKLNLWVRNNGPSGWDIYDGLYSDLMNRVHSPALRISILQLNKYCPINLRTFFGINKGVDTKGLSLLSYSSALAYSIFGDRSYLDIYYAYNKHLIEKSLKNEIGYHAWMSHYFPYVTVGEKETTSTNPDIIVTSRMIVQLIAGYKVTHDNSLKNMAVEAGKFLIDKLLVRGESDYFFKYNLNSLSENIVYNASAHALEALAAILEIEKSPEMNEVLQSVAMYLVNKQNEDGSWDYSVFPERNKRRVQLDFHQGYMLDGLFAALPYVKNKDSVLESISHGASFYKNKMFRQNGSSYFRYPKPFPVDIHNQAQGIITFSKLGTLNVEYAKFSTVILDWTIKNMQDPSGYFHYQKWPLVTNKIPYMRWSEAWMMVAFSVYFSYRNSDLFEWVKTFGEI